MSASRRRSGGSAPVLSLLLLSFTACGVAACGTDPKPTADPGPVQSAAASAAAASSAPNAPPSGAVVLDTSKTAGPGAAPAPSAAESAEASAPSSMPKAPNGLVGKAVADGILGTGQPPKLTVVSPGAEPRETLQYAFVAGESAKVNMGMKMRMQMSTGGRQLPAPEIPKLNMLLDLGVKSKTPKGDFELDGGILEVGVSPKGELEQQVAVKMQPQLDAMKGVRIHYFVSPTGKVRDVNVSVPGGEELGTQQTLGQMTHSFESMVAPLPTDAVGVGAKWEVVSRIASSGADLLQWATYELTSREGSMISMDLSVRQLAADSAIAAPGMPPGMTASLQSFHSEGRGKSKLDLGSPAPVGGQVAVQSTMKIAVQGGAGAAQQPGMESMSVQSHVTVDFSRPAPVAK